MLLVLTLIGLLLTLLLAALDQTIVTTALPRITADLGGFDHYTWVTTAYLVSSTVLVPVAGKLSDQLGRKPLLVASTLAFLATSILCAQAQDFNQLVAARVLQGVAGGAITAAVFATVPTLFSPGSRARIIGLFTGTYGLASIIGPLAGGLITDTFGWRGVFYVNVPIGILALLLVWRTYTPVVAPAQRPRIDYLGFTTLVLGVTPLLLALSLGGHEVAWTSPLLIGLLLASAVFLFIFVRIEMRAEQPVLPLGMLRSRSVGIASLGMVFTAGTLFATALFTPLFVQVVIGSSATSSGGVLAPMMLSFVLASVLVGQFLARVPQYRLVGMAGLGLAATGQLLMAGMGPDTDYTVVARNLVVTGFGIGSALAAFVVASQNAVPVAMMGVATALGAFARASGSTLASAGFGSLLAARLPGTLTPITLSSALHDTFLTSFVMLCVGVLLVLLLNVDEEPSPAKRLVPLPAYGSEDRRARRLDELLGSSTGD
jgi:EmrB/QacA subfamily drug resistance transporter